MRLSALTGSDAPVGTVKVSLDRSGMIGADDAEREVGGTGIGAATHLAINWQQKITTATGTNLRMAKYTTSRNERKMRMTQVDDARQVWTFLRGYGVSESVTAGILGNMQAESGMRSDVDEYGGGGGYGLVQWTPKSKLTDWAAQQGLDPATISTQCARIAWEADSGQQFYKTGTSFWEWLKSDLSAEQAADDFVRYYERPAVANSEARRQFARAWFNQFASETRSTSGDASSNPASSVGSDGGQMYTVQPGDNLTLIAVRHDTTWQVIARLNNLANADLIYPGQVLRIG